MFKFIATICVFIAAANAAGISNEYLPPVQDVAYQQPAPIAQSYEASSYEVPSGGFVDAEPAHSYSDDEGYRYKTAKRRVFRNRRVFRQRRRY